jgi:Pyruvate/2-oxoacid:ferredoxin oxidoreductase delta subunit
MKESTKKIIKAHGWRLDRAIHYYIYFKYYHGYVRVLLSALGKNNEMLAKLDPDGLKYKVMMRLRNSAEKLVFSRYHGKVLSPGDVKKIIKVEENVTLGTDTTRRIVPFKYARDILLNEPTQIAVMDCPCKAVLENPCQPISACIAVGRPVSDFWLEHCEKYNVRKITKEEALDIIEQHRRTGHFNQIFFKVTTGGRTGVICNCCKKCCGGGVTSKIIRNYIDQNRGKVLSAKEGHGDPLEGVSAAAPSGYTVKHDVEKCTLCGKCIELCNFDAIVIEDGRRTVNLAYCMGCGVCAELCPSGAISLVYEEKGGYIPLDLDLVKEKLASCFNQSPRP